MTENIYEGKEIKLYEGKVPIEKGLSAEEVRKHNQEMIGTLYSAAPKIVEQKLDQETIDEHNLRVLRECRNLFR